LCRGCCSTAPARPPAPGGSSPRATSACSQQQRMMVSSRHQAVSTPRNKQHCVTQYPILKVASNTGMVQHHPLLPAVPNSDAVSCSHLGATAAAASVLPPQIRDII
jgi:hypothetical protein